MAKLRFLFLLVILAVAANAQRAMTVAEVETFVKSQMKLGADRDHATAEYLLKNIKLKEHLDDRIVEEWQGQGVGRETIRALRKLATDSASLPAPPPVVIVAPPPPPKPPSAQEQAEVLEAVKQYALNYTTGLPNYVCTQITRRKQSPTDKLRSQGYIGNGDTIQETLTFFEHKETYKVVLWNGKAVNNVSHEQLGGTRSSGEFGSMLSNIFEKDSGAEFAWERWATLDKHRMYVFSYHMPKSNGYSMADEEVHREYTAAYRGLIYADHDTKEIMRITLDTEGIPADFPIHEVHIQLDYDHVKISDQDFLLPFRYQLTSKASNVETENIAEFRGYKKYGAEATIIFDDAPISDERLKEQPDAPTPPAAPVKK